EVFGEMLDQPADQLPEVKDRLTLLLLMGLFLLLGVAWGVAVAAELKGSSTSFSRRSAPVDITAAVPGGQTR
ncbi:MAG TPA: hypothetical protein VG498_03240, partial [Terriglobales bacterium]|nr:hypothetical protein [Terriglobales bacterium]